MSYYSLPDVSLGAKSFSKFVHELLSVEICVSADIHSVMDTDSKILSHESSFNGLNDNFFESLAEESELIVVIELGTVCQTSGPGID